MKKVLFVATVDSHINHFHIPYLKYFKEQGYEVHVATGEDGQIEYCDKKIIIPIQRSPIKIENIKAIKQLKKVIEKEQYEIIHCHTPMGSVVTRLAAKKARKKGTRVIYTAHGFHFFKGAPLLNWLIYYPIEKWLSKYTDTLITINQEDYDRAKKHFKAKNIELVHGVGVDEKKFDFTMTDEEKKDFREELGVKENDFVITIVGELNKNKNQIMAIEAMKELVRNNKEIKLLLVGKGVLEEEYKSKIKQYNLDNNILMLGYRTDIPKILKISDLLLSLSYREGLPVNVIEAMMCGLPIIATNCRGNRDLVQDDKNGYIIEINDTDGLKSKIQYLKENKQYIVKIREENNNKKNNYTENRIKNQIIKIYNRKLKVLHVLNSNKYSGAENVVCTIIENMTNCNLEMVYCSPKGEIEKVLESRNIKYIGIDKLDKHNLKKVIKEYRPDIIHAHDFRASIVCASVVKNERLISHIHQNPIWIKKINLYSILYLISSIKYKNILVVSVAVKNEYIFSRFIDKKVTTIGNPIDVKRIRTLAGEDETIKYDVIYLGRLSDEKDPLRFIRIIKLIKEKIPQVKAVMVGDGVLRKECENMIQQLELKENIDMLGFMENPYPILKYSKILCMTSKWEGFGLVATEAIALGKIVVAHAIGGISNLVNDKYGKLYYYDEEAVTEIVKLLQNIEYYNAKVNNSINKSVTIKNLECYIKNYYNILFK